MTKELSEFFKIIEEDKKNKKEKFNSIVGDLGLDELFCEFSSLKNESKTKKIKEQKSAKAFEKWLYTESKQESKKVKKNKIKECNEEKNENLQENITLKNNLLLKEKSLGLLSEPSNVKQNNDPLTPLDQKFVTINELQKHYTEFLSRIQQQLSTLGGGGETRLEFLDDVNRNSIKVNHKFLRYDSTTKKWNGSDAGEGPFISSTTYVTQSSYVIKEHDYYIGVNYSGSVSITLPTNVIEGTTYIVKDERGEASKGMNRYITIFPSGSDLIDGRDRAILAFDYGSLTFVYRNGWRVV